MASLVAAGIARLIFAIHDSTHTSALSSALLCSHLQYRHHSTSDTGFGRYLVKLDRLEVAARCVFVRCVI